MGETVPPVGICSCEMVPSTETWKMDMDPWPWCSWKMVSSMEMDLGEMFPPVDLWKMLSYADLWLWCSWKMFSSMGMNLGEMLPSVDAWP